jgi:hypothetical protein
MTEPTRFEADLATALTRYADRAAIEIDPIALTRVIATGRATSGSRRSSAAAFGRRRGVSVVLVIALIASIAGVAILGGQLLRTRPAVIVTPGPGSPSPTVAPSPSQPTPTATHVPARPAALPWTSPAVPGADGLNDIPLLWSLGDRLIAVAEARYVDGIDPHRSTFLRSDDGVDWVTAPAPAKGLEIETGVVVDGTLWLVGNVGPPDDPHRGIWSTRDGATWDRVKNLTGLDFGAGVVTALAHASAGWVALAYRSLNAESSVAELYRSTDGIRWSKTPFPDMGQSPLPNGLASDGDRWVLTLNKRSDTGTEVWALVSVDGVVWTPTRIAMTVTGSGPPTEIDGSALTFGPEGFVIVGQDVVGETPRPVAWRSSDGTTWTSGRMDGLPGTAGETGLGYVIATDDGYLAMGYRENEVPTFWVSADGIAWTQFDDLATPDPVSEHSLAASQTRVVIGGQLPGGAPFIWSAPR